MLPVGVGEGGKVTEVFGTEIVAMVAGVGALVVTILVKVRVVSNIAVVLG